MSKVLPHYRSDDHIDYVERRAAIADEEEERNVALAAQCARQHHAITRSVERMRQAINGESIDHHAAAIMHGAINELARANERRVEDGIPDEPLITKVISVVLPPPVALALVEDGGEVICSIGE